MLCPTACYNFLNLLGSLFLASGKGYSIQLVISLLILWNHRFGPDRGHSHLFVYNNLFSLWSYFVCLFYMEFFSENKLNWMYQLQREQTNYD